MQEHHFALPQRWNSEVFRENNKNKLKIDNNLL